MKAKGRRVGLIFLGLVCLALATLVLLTWRAWRQERLNPDLIAAIKSNDTSTAIRVLEAGADPNIKTAPTSVSFAQSLRELLDRLRGGAVQRVTAHNLEHPLLPQAVQYGNVRLVVSLLDHGAHVDAECRVHRFFSETSLMIAVQNDSVDLVRVLIAHGANVNWKDVNGITPLMEASDASIMNLLLDHGADIHARTTGTDPNGMPPLFMNDGFPALMRLLLTRGANINERADSGVTLVMAAAEYGRATAIRFGLDHGVDVNARDHDGNTALMYAIEGAGDAGDNPTSVEAVKVLLAEGANVNARNWGQWRLGSAGSTALSMALSAIDRLKNETPPATNKGMMQIVGLLKAAGARK